MRLIRRLAAAVASAGLMFAGLGVIAPPAHAACPTAGYTDAIYTWSGSGATVRARTNWVDCGSYIRLTGFGYDDTANVSYTYAHSVYGTPKAQWFSVGNNNAVNTFNAYARWYDELSILLGNQACYKPCTFTVYGKAAIVSYSDPDWLLSRQINP
jgi:hypothetical protein